jgi:hypothetical protein
MNDIKYFRFSILLYLLILFLSMEAKGQGPPIFTETPIMLGLDGGGVRTFGKFFSKENAKSIIVPFIVPFNLTSKWQIGGVAPFLLVAPNDAESRFNLSDLKFFTKFQIFQKNGKGKTLRSLIKLTETFPTGNTSKAPPLGTGSWQTTMSLVTGYVTLNYGIYTEIGYNLTTNGLPDNLIYNVAFAYPLLPQKYPPQQINVFLEFNGNLITDNGINSLFISPGVQFIAGRTFLIETGIQIPLTTDLPEAQRTKFMYTLGTRVLIF